MPGVPGRLSEWDKNAPPFNNQSIMTGAVNKIAAVDPMNQQSLRAGSGKIRV
jgi:hypothetical protein